MTSPENDNSSSLGVPIIGYEDFESLMWHQELCGEGSLSISQIGQMISSTKSIKTHITFDMDTWEEQQDMYDEGNEAEILEFLCGIESGYSLIFGVFALTAFYKEGQTEDLTKFLSNLPSKENLFKSSESIFERAKAVRLGKISVEDIDLGFFANSSDLAYIHSSEIMHDSVRLEDLVHRQEKSIRYSVADEYDTDPMNDDIVKSSLDGFTHGVAQALELFVQTVESQTIQNLEEQF